MRKKSKLSRGYKHVKHKRCKHNWDIQVKFNKCTKKVNTRANGRKPRGPIGRVEEGPSQYTIYHIVNSGAFMNTGYLAASVARGFLKLYNKIERDKVASNALDDWEDTGQKLVVLDGINHKHLKHLASHLEFAALKTSAVFKRRGRTEIMLVLSTFGKEEYLEEIFDGLTYLR